MGPIQRCSSILPTPAAKNSTKQSSINKDIKTYTCIQYHKTQFQCQAAKQSINYEQKLSTFHQHETPFQYHRQQIKPPCLMFRRAWEGTMRASLGRERGRDRAAMSLWIL